MKKKIQQFLVFSDYQYFDTGMKMINFLMNTFSTSLKFLIDVLMEEIKSSVTEKLEF